MPTTLTGLILFLVLLVPGFTFVSVRRRFRPIQQLSVFQETASVAIASTAAVAAALGLFALCRNLWPRHTPDVGQLIRDGTRYVEQDYVLVGAWAAGVVAAATALAGLAGMAAGRWQKVHPSQMSSWWLLFDHQRRGRNVEVGCTLTDGTYYQGMLTSYSMLADDTEDRDLVLKPPILIRQPGRKTLKPYAVSGVGLSARKIVWITASLVETPVSIELLESARRKREKRDQRRLNRRRPAGHSDPSQKEVHLDQPASESP